MASALKNPYVEPSRHEKANARTNQALRFKRVRDQHCRNREQPKSGK
jgi:hypothetical protein